MFLKRCFLLLSIFLFLSLYAEDSMGQNDVVNNAGGGGSVIMGSLDRSVIDAYIRRNLAKIRWCYEKELNKNPKLAGKIVVNFIISSTGEVSKSVVENSTMGNASAESCVAREIKKIRFPKPKGGGIIIVTYPFVFKNHVDSEEPLEQNSAVCEVADDETGYGMAKGSIAGKGRGKISAGGSGSVIMGSLDKSVVDIYIRRNLARSILCYEKELDKNPKLFGKIVINFIISSTGEVTKSVVKRTTMGNALVESCLAREIKEIRFPKPKSGGICIVTYPFVFKN